MGNYLIVLVITIILIMLWNLVSMNVANYEEYMRGSWVGDPLFCQEAEIDSIQIAIGEPISSWSQTRNAYIIIQSGGELICNQGLVLKYSRGWGGPTIGKYKICAEADFDEEPVWGESGRVTISIDIIKGIMRIYDAETLYARLYKSNELSNIFANCPPE